MKLDLLQPEKITISATGALGAAVAAAFVLPFRALLRPRVHRQHFPHRLQHPGPALPPVVMVGDCLPQVRTFVFLTVCVYLAI